MNRTRLAVHCARLAMRYRLRTFAMALGSFIGVAALTIVISVGQGATQKITKTVHQLFGGSSIIIVAGGSQFFGGPRADTARLTIDDIQAIASDVPGIAVWDPQLVQPGATIRHGDRTATARVLGQSERSRVVWNRDVSRGDYFDAQDVAGSARVALIGESLAARLFGADDPIGADISVGSTSFRVIGVLARFGTDIHGMDRDNELVVPVTSLQRRVMNVDTIVQAKLLVADPSAVASTARAATRVLRARHSLPDGRPNDFEMITADDVRQMVSFVERLLFVYLPLVAAVCLIAGGITAAALMLGSVVGRTGEIGLRGAVGALPEDIRWQFAAETFVAVAAGGLGGVLFGFVGAIVATTHLRLGPRFSWEAAAVGFAVSAAVGMVAGIVPARRAAALPPADALR